MPILRFFGIGSRDAEGEPASAIRKITESLDRLEPERAKYLAAFAYLLSRAARADLDVSGSETRTMERIVTQHGGLPEDQAILVVQLAKTQNLLLGGTEDFLVTREFNKIATQEQKIALLHCLFAVSSSDDSIATVEDNEIRRIARELRIDHADFIAVRSAFKQHLAVLKEPPANDR